MNLCELDNIANYIIGWATFAKYYAPFPPPTYLPSLYSTEMGTQSQRGNSPYQYA